MPVCDALYRVWLPFLSLLWVSFQHSQIWYLSLFLNFVSFRLFFLTGLSPLLKPPILITSPNRSVLYSFDKDFFPPSRHSFTLTTSQIWCFLLFQFWSPNIQNLPYDPNVDFFTFHSWFFPHLESYELGITPTFDEPIHRVYVYPSIF